MWSSYGEDLESDLKDRSSRLQRGAYRAKPVRRVYIAKADGRQRPIGVPALEGKLVQTATVEVRNAVYETDFLGFTHYCSKTRQGWFTIKRSTVQKRIRRKIPDLKVALRRRLHEVVPDVGRWLGRVVRGYYNYYAVPFNSRCLAQF